MPQFHQTIHIDAPPQRVWEVMTDVERWPEWTPTMTSVRLLDSGPLSVGSRAAIRQPKLPAATWSVTELEEGRRFTWVTRSPGVCVHGRHSVEADGTGSRATLAIEFSGWLGPLMGALLRGLNERYLTLEAQGLKARSESR